MGKGDGTFARETNYSGGHTPTAIAVADLNGDGKPDVLVLNTTAAFDAPNQTVNVYLGKGDGTFQTAVSYPAGGSALLVADLNRDGLPDIVAVNDKASVLIGNGDGTFQPHVDYSAGLAPSAVAFADMTGDGQLDLVTAAGDRSVNILAGNGDGTFQPPISYPIGTPLPTSLVVKDINGDGMADFVVTDGRSATVDVLTATCLP